MRRISDKEHKRQVLFNLLIGFVILGLLIILIGFPLKLEAGGTMGFDLIFSPLNGVIILIPSVVGLALAYIIVGAPTENIWKKPVVILPLGIILGGIIGYFLGNVLDMFLTLPFNMNVNIMLLGLLIGFGLGLFFVRSYKKKSQEEIS